MGKRQIVGLRWAKELDERPATIPKGRARGVKAFGLRYEKALEKALPIGFAKGIWFEFEDRNGPGLCQVDFLTRGVVLEAKYSWIEDAHIELEKLYLPVVEAAQGRSPLGLVVCKNLALRMGNVSVEHSLGEALRAARNRRSVLHWIGKVPLLAESPSSHKNALAGAFAPL